MKRKKKETERWKHRNTIEGEAARNRRDTWRGLNGGNHNYCTRTLEMWEGGVIAESGG